MLTDKFETRVIGHGRIKEYDQFEIDHEGNAIPKGKGKVLMDKCNAIHPQNMARIIARALANESNYFIHGVAFGNGGTEVNASGIINFKPPRDGLNPGDNGYQARLYNQTYAEIVDDSNVNIGAGVGASPEDDPTSIEHVSGPGVRSVEDLTEGSTISSVVIQVVLNPNEPSGQAMSQQGEVTDMESNFTFDEIGLFTAGAPLESTSGYQYWDVGGKTSVSDTGLQPNTMYKFHLSVDGSLPEKITFTTPSVGTGNGIDAPTDAITYGDLIDNVFNVPGSPLDSAGAVAEITNNIPTQNDGTGVETYGYFSIMSKSTGSNSSIQVTESPEEQDGAVSIFNQLSGFVAVVTGVVGQDGGVRNDPTNPTTETERMLSHLIFNPITKTRDRVLTLTYTLNIVVARTS